MNDIEMDDLKQKAKELVKREIINNPEFPSEIGPEYYTMLDKFIESRHCTKPNIKRMIELLEKNSNHDQQEKTIVGAAVDEIVKRSQISIAHRTIMEIPYLSDKFD